MKQRIVIEKKVGETPLMALNAWRSKNPDYQTLPASYAGRLDPMASGKLLILVGEKCKKRERYTGLDKEYEIEVVLDLVTDTGDVLGIPAYAERNTIVDATTLAPILTALRGTHTLPYPAFSSKTVAGKPLFLYALEGTLNTIDIPTHAETIYRIEALQLSCMTRVDLRRRIETLLDCAPKSDEPSKRIGADFRQDMIRSAWSAIYAGMPDRSFTLVRLRVTCASGTYMRTLAARLGAACGTTALALSIHRSKIGRYLPLPFGLGLWRSIQK